MTEIQTTNNYIPIPKIPKRRDIDWAQYLDFTLFIESGEIGNDDLEKYQEDLLP